LGHVQQRVTGMQLQQRAGWLHRAGRGTAAGSNSNQLGVVGSTQSEGFL